MKMALKLLLSLLVGAVCVWFALGKIDLPKTMEVLTQMWDFERLLLAECQEQGLISDDVRTEIELKKHSLEALGRHAPVKR